MFFPKLNNQAYSELDFWRICREQKIIVKELPLKVDGYYEFYKGKHYILINSELKGLARLKCLMHELCHRFLHQAYIENKKHFVMYRNAKFLNNRADKEADAIAVILICPLPMLKKMLTEDLSDHKSLFEIIEQRKKVLLEYGI